MSAEFRVGDVVRLKSGGPDMTIRRLTAQDGDDATIIHTKWMQDGETKYSDNPEVTLEHVEDCSLEYSGGYLAPMARANAQDDMNELMRGMYLNARMQADG